MSFSVRLTGLDEFARAVRAGNQRARPLFAAAMFGDGGRSRRRD